MNDDELVYRRVFRAPRELVWRCLTEPAELAHFWGPSGMATPIDGIVVELHPGGRFETLMRRRARQPPDGRHLHRGRPARTARLGRAGDRDAHHQHARTTSATAQPQSSSISGTCPRRCACPRPAPASSPPSTSSRSTSLTSCKETDRDRPAVLGSADLPGARRSSRRHGCRHVGCAVAVREVAGAPCGRARDDAGAADSPAVRGRDGGGRRRLHRTFRHRGHAGRLAAGRRPPRPAPIADDCTRGSRRAAVQPVR